jgi:hypothetical protein
LTATVDRTVVWKGEERVMKKVCSYCGALMEEGAKICTNCGKVVPSQNKTASQSGQFNNFDDSYNEKRTASTRNAPRVNPQDSLRKKSTGGTPSEAKRNKVVDSDYDPVRQARQERIPFVTNASSGKQENSSKIMPIIGMLVKIIIAVAVLFVGFSFVRCYLVSSKGYDFKLDESITLNSDTYGDAFDNYFEEGKWRYHIKGNKVVYTGTTKDGETYEMYFGKYAGQTAVTRLTIDGKSVDEDKIMQLYIMPMFMA